jgi:hypothetical protein
MIGAQVPELAGDRVDLAVELIDQYEAGLDVLAPRLGDLETPQQLAPGDTEQVGDPGTACRT